MTFSNKMARSFHLQKQRSKENDSPDKSPNSGDFITEEQRTSDVTRLRQRRLSTQLKVCRPGFVISVYLSSLPVAHLRDAPRGGLVVTGHSARIQDETTDNHPLVFLRARRIALPHGTSGYMYRLIRNNWFFF